MHPECDILGVDINEPIVGRGNEILRAKGLANCSLETGDLYDLPGRFRSRFDRVICFETLSWLPYDVKPLEAIVDLNAPWIAPTSLFYSRRMSCAIEVTEHGEVLSPSQKSFCNIYSLPVLKRHVLCAGYTAFDFQEFNIYIDLRPPPSGLMRTHNRRMRDGQRLQVSGPLLMPWHFVSAGKS